MSNMNNPFSDYLPFEKKGWVVVPKIFSPSVDIEPRRDGSIEVFSAYRRTQILLTNDLRHMADSKIKKGNIQSFLHEGLLAIMMENLLGEIGHGSKRGVLQVREKDTSKEYIVDSDENYILKHKGRSNFILLEKETTPVGRKRYQMEKESYMATEIDGLGYLINDPSYLLIGEAAKGTEFKLNAWGRGHKKDVFTRLFTPMQELFSDHQLMYLVFTRGEVIFDNGHQLSQRAENLYHKLKEINIQLLVVPTPETDPSLEELAIRSHERLNIIRGQMGHRLV